MLLCFREEGGAALFQGKTEAAVPFLGGQGRCSVLGRRVVPTLFLGRRVAGGWVRGGEGPQFCFEGLGFAAAFWGEELLLLCFGEEKMVLCIGEK